MKKIRYIFPQTENFRETRPTICWEHMYGWMEGYGMLFDPAAFTGLIPEWENGWNQETEAGDFIITSCAQASELFENLDIPGIYVRPSMIPGNIARSRKSEKEKLSAPTGKLFYPMALPYDKYEGATGPWMLGEDPAVKRIGPSIAVSFEMFAMLGYFRDEMPEVFALKGADMVASLMEECGASTPSGNIFSADLRMDCQAYGLNRLLLQWFLDIKGETRDTVKIADASFLQAMAAIRSGKGEAAGCHLGEAFGHLAKAREAHSAIDLHFLEYPHLGILFEDKGFFELEWPHYSKDTLLSYFAQVEKNGYKVSLEAGGSCWQNLATRYPRLGETMAKLWNEGAIELTNGTFSLPYALMSPLSLQYWQFQKGHAAFQSTFGKTPTVYQCQENSLTPQMPELLNHFEYERALHIAQNHGEAPAEETDFINWASPAGHRILSMATRHPAIARKGLNYFLDLPLIHAEYGASEQALNYVNFQDIGYVPFRIHMIRAHKYASVWGRFGLDKEFFPSAPINIPAKGYSADSYKFSEKFFYSSETNRKPFSHYEAIYALSARLRQLRIAGFSSGQQAEMYRILDKCVGQICLLEAHDCSYCQGQRRGEFYSNRNEEVPPYSKETLAQKIREIISETTSEMDRAEELLHSNHLSENLFNAAEVPLVFGKIRSPESYCGKNTVSHGGDTYAAGPFPAFASCEPVGGGAPACEKTLPFEIGLWRVEAGDQGKIAIIFNGQRLTCIPVDNQKGAFKLLSSEMESAGGLNFLKLHYQLVGQEIQTVILDLVFADQGGYAEINLCYSPRSDFQVVNKWDDYLALEVQCDSGLAKVWRFNPNVRALTSERRTVSPYYLATELADCSSFSLMNEGCPLYDIDRENGTVRWLFHVFGESVFRRRMGIVFASKDVFQLSRAWGQGLLKSNPKVIPFLQNIDWRGVSLEDFVGPDTMLISNLAEEARALPIDLHLFSSAENMLGENVFIDSHLKLKPMELALVRI